MRYALIDQLRKLHPVAKLCDVLEVAKSGYQVWNTGKVVSPRIREELHLLLAIKVAHQRGRGTYSPRKIRDELADLGIWAGLNRIKRLRKRHGIRCTHKRKFRVTTDSKHRLPVAPNLRNPGQVCCTTPTEAASIAARRIAPCKPATACKHP